jgi:hypothetical protein
VQELGAERHLHLQLVGDGEREFLDGVHGSLRFTDAEQGMAVFSSSSCVTDPHIRWASREWA